MDTNVFDDYRKEYWFHVSNQDEIPIFGKVEKSIDLTMLYNIAKAMPNDQQDKYLAGIIESNANAINTLRTIVGVTDKRMYLELSYSLINGKLVLLIALTYSENLFTP